MTRAPSRWAVTALVALLVTVPLRSACIGGDEDTSDDPSETAESVLGAAADRWGKTQSAHFALEVDGDAYLDKDETVRLLSAEGDIKRPDAVKADAKVNAAGFPADLSIISIGGTTWWTSLLSGRWEPAPADFTYNPAILFDDDDGIGPILRNLQDPELQGDEAVDGAESRRVEGTVTAGDVSRITAGAIEGDRIRVTVWVGKKDATIRKVELTEPEGIRENPATWTLHLTDHDEDVTIEPPPT